MWRHLRRSVTLYTEVLTIAVMQARAPLVHRNACVTRREYFPSAWEQWWRAHAGNLGDSRHFELGCAKVKNDSALVAAWLELAAQRAPHRSAGSSRASSSMASSVEGVSYHRISQTCAAATAPILIDVPIEPLVSFLRHPHHFCVKRMSLKTDKSYLLPPWRSEVLPRPASDRAFLFDVGASTWTKGLGGTSQGWFFEQSARRGLPLRRMVAWEAKQRSEAEVRLGLPRFLLYGTRIYRQPPRLEGSCQIRQPSLLEGSCSNDNETLSYHNYPVSAARGDASNPLEWVRVLTSPEDYVVLKLDIDTPTIERALIDQMLADSEVRSRVDELYWEHEVHTSPMVHQGWGAHGWPNETLAQSYELFTRLRELGIRAHSWV